MPIRATLATLTLIAIAAMIPATARAAEPTRENPIRVGIIGLDTSHVVAFSKSINDPDAKGALEVVEVVAAYPGFSPDIPDSRDRVEGFTRELRNMGVEIVDSIDALLPKVDAVLIESLDGRPHVEQLEAVVAAKKPVFVDKPLAGSLADVLRIERIAREGGVPWFSSSSLRYSPSIIGMRGGANEKVGGVLGCSAYGSCTIEPHHPDLFWYGIHGVETLYTIMGTGCQSVARAQTEGTDLVTGIWNDGRIGTYRGLRIGEREFGAQVFGEKGIAVAGPYAGYQPLVEQIGEFFVTGKPPIDVNETIEIYAFMEAADESKRQGGAAVTIESVMEKARAVAESE